MKEFIEKNHKILAILGSIIVITIISSGLIFGPLNYILPDSLREKLGYGNDQTINEELTVQLSVEFNGFSEDINYTLLIPANQSVSAYSILLYANLSVTVENFPNGIYVKGINGVIEDATHFWWYFVNGVSGTVASNLYDLRSNEISVITWQYTSN